MIDQFKSKIYKSIKKYNIDIDDDVFSYGFDVFTNYFIYIIIIIPLACILNLFCEVFFFIIFFMILRKNIGGFHFNKLYYCTFFSIFFSLLIPFVSKKFIIKNIYMMLFIFILLMIITITIGTMDHTHKILSEIEKKQYSRNSLIILLIYMAICLLCFYLKLNILTNIIIATSIFNILGIILQYMIQRLHL